MKQDDPFVQLEAYMKQQKTAPKVRSRIQTNQPQDQSRGGPSKTFVVNEKAPVVMNKPLNAMELRNPIRTIPPQPGHSTYEKEQSQYAKRGRRASPIDNPNKISRNPILQTQEPSQENIAQSVFTSKKRVTPSRSLSQKSYDFAGPTKHDAEEIKRVQNRKTNLAHHFHESSDYWNRETKTVYKEIISELSPDRQKSAERVSPREPYEDPKLKRMKQIMNQHKKVISQKESNGVLKGISESRSIKDKKHNGIAWRCERSAIINGQHQREEGRHAP